MSAILPVAGGSPFHCKGLVYQGAKAYYEKRIPGGTKEMRSWMTDPALFTFWDRDFLAGAWYDALPIVELSRAAAHAAGVPHLILVKENARAVAERDIHGVYKVLLRLASPELVVKRLPRAALQYFDFGEVRDEQLEGKSFTATQFGIPEHMSAWMSACIQAFSPVALETAGAKNVRVRTTVSPVVGQREGVDLVEIRIQMTWD